MLKFWFSKQFSRFDLWVVYPICVVIGFRASWWLAAVVFLVLCIPAVLGERALKREDQKQLLRRAMLWPPRGGAR